jgi:hypothetical protein
MSQPLAPAPPYRDRYGGLVAFGILELLLAAGCLLLVTMLLMSAGMRLPNMPSPQPAASLISAAAVYLAAAAAFGALGAGSILARRWARTLSLVVGWLWLAVGAIGGIFLLLILPRMFAAMPGMEDPAAKAFAIGCMSIGWGLGFVLLPLALVLFYGSRNARATSEARDPRPRWTDRCPVPVLALALMSAFAALTFTIYSLHPAVPVFGRIWTGAAAAALFLLLAGLEAAIAWGLYRLRPAAWWGRLGLWLVSGTWTAIGFAQGVDWQRLLQASGQPDTAETRRLLSGMFQGPLFVTLMIVVAVACLGYLLWVKRYFAPRPA